ncbi:kinase-like domain-containing protein [Trichoderma austrokoningii]
MSRRHPKDDYPYVASDIVAIGLEGDARPGILTVMLHEAAGFSIPDQFQEALSSYFPMKNNATRALSVASQAKVLPYAMVDFDRSIALVKASSGTIQSPSWAADTGSSKFDTTTKKSQDVFLGSVRIKPALTDSQISSEEWFQSEAGAGKLRITMAYTTKETLDVEPLKYTHPIGHGSWGEINAVITKDTQRLYALKEIPKSEIITWPEVLRNLRSYMESPFITPITFISQVRTVVCFFSPAVQGGHLFDHLQKAHHFDVQQSTFYAAEILCALESIHKARSHYNGPKPKNILLDSLGHITLCDFSLFSVEKGNAEHAGYLEYPAPEILSSQGITKAEKWWTLGVLLYEMLTGMPPFYDADVNETYRRILSDPVQLPESFSPAAQDILAKLLTLTSAAIYSQNLAQISDKPLAPPNKFYFKSFPTEGDIYGSSSDSSSSIHSQTFIKDDERWEVVDNKEWELVWDSADQTFHFYNRFTDAKEEIKTSHSRTTYTRNGPPSTHQLTGDSTLSELPTQEVKRDALEAIFKTKYKHLVPKLLQTYGMDLNTYILLPKVNPLYHAVELEDFQLAKMLLDTGAELNMKKSIETAPLIKAVKKGNEELTNLLVQRTDRVNCTLALGQAVRQQAMAIVNILLANGIKWDFEESDRPLSCPVCSLGAKDRTPIDWFMPPLVYAVKLGNKNLARLLLAHGADANIDIYLPQPTRQSHTCCIISREEHLEANAALMEAVESSRVKA